MEWECSRADMEATNRPDVPEVAYAAASPSGAGARRARFTRDRQPRRTRIRVPNNLRPQLAQYHLTEGAYIYQVS